MHWLIYNAMLWVHKKDWIQLEVINVVKGQFTRQLFGQFTIIHVKITWLKRLGFDAMETVIAEIILDNAFRYFNKTINKHNEIQGVIYMILMG